MDRPPSELQRTEIAALTRAIKAQSLQLAALKSEVEELREAQEHVARRILAADDRRTGSVLVPLLSYHSSTKPFTAAEISATALNDQTLRGQALCEMIKEWLTEEGDLRAFGQLLARLEGVWFRGRRLVSDGQAHGVARWRVSTRSKPAATDTLREDD